jgi:HSP20 family protein
MTSELSRRLRRPSWMTPFGREGMGDIFFDRLWPEFPLYTGEEWDPVVNVYEKDGKYHVTADIPGIKKEDIDVSYDNGCLTISGKREFGDEEKGSDYYRRETRFGSFCRTFRLPGTIDAEKIEATYKDGVLSLVLPRKGGAKGKKITVH